MASSVPSSRQPYHEREDVFMRDLKKPESKPCAQLLLMREFAVAMNQMKHTYFRRWFCLRDWPCPLTQHRDEIDKILERMVPMTKDLEVQCDLQIQDQQVGNASHAILKNIGNPTTTATAIGIVETINLYLPPPPSCK